ncbi:hypothetical protein GGP89_002840 [Salinibacter ruber]|uniref:Uncharacterized protein n=1 Tax=Salinibacter ruber TaxID=146919 RepID=A0A9X2Z116_9BACT|nr:hypothetical protein [Salinibacter ruber]MCS3859439.1 hypothetical protein [Salinibacter ruber]MCS3866319.1 hypothetical protein [Salinibacter ruber]
MDKDSILYDVAKGYAAQIASKMLDGEVLDGLMPHQKTYREQRRENVRQVLFNLIKAQSLSRAHRRLIKVAVPLTKMRESAGRYDECHISYRQVKSIIETFEDAGLLAVDQGKPFYQTSSEWKKRCVEENRLRTTKGALRGRVTEIWATGKLKEAIGGYLSGNTHLGADVEMIVEEPAVLVRSPDGELIDTCDTPRASHFQSTVAEVCSRVRDRARVSLHLPLTALPSIRGNTSLQQRSSGDSPSSPSPTPHSPSSSIRRNTSPHRQPSEVPADVSPSCPVPSPPDNALSSIRGNTSPHRLQRVHEAERAHEAVVRKCPAAWMWAHELKGSRIEYTVPEMALEYQRKFCRGSWDCGGRFYADVQNVPSDWRKHMRIGGEPVVEIDYDNLHIAMLYAGEEKRLGGDAYNITSSFDLGAEMDEVIGLREEEIGFYRQRQRKVVKRALNVLINAENYQSAYEALKHHGWTEEIGAPLANDVFKPLVGALRKKHEPISNYFHSDAGILLQRKDSDLAYKVMTQTGAIGIHDGFVIEASREKELRDAMKRAFAEEYGGYDIGVSREFEPLTPDGDFALDRTSPAESGADRKRRASQLFTKVRSELFRAPQNGSEERRPLPAPPHFHYSSDRNTNTLYSASDWSMSS